MKRYGLFCLAILVSHCKTTGSHVNRRGVIPAQNIEAPGQGEELIAAAKSEGAVVIPRETVEETAIAVETEQVVTSKEVESAPVIKQERVDAPPVMVPEIGSQCKVPVSAGCLGISSVMTEEKEGSVELGKALKKYGRLITPAMHACNYHTRNLNRYTNISYFTDLVVYWSETATGVSYWAFPVNFIFSAGCLLDDDFKNPFLADLKATQTWDGTSSLKSLGYTFGSNLPLPASFAVDRLKAEKITQETHNVRGLSDP